MIRKIGLIFCSFIRDLIIYILVFSLLLSIVGLFGLKIYNNYRNKILNEYNLSTYAYSPSLKTEIYSEDNVLLAEVYNEDRTYIPMSDMPELLKESMVAVEDRRFYEHNGVDAYGIVRALVKNITSGNLRGQGASTITQQLTRELFLSQDKTIERKIKEIFIAMELEKKYDKNKILEIYLNEIYFGHGAYGIESASKIYFGKSAKDLDASEIAILVGLPQAPSLYDPFVNPEKTKKRRIAVLDCMYRDNLISKKEVDTINNSEIILADVASGKKAQYYKHPYFTAWIIQQLEKQYGEKVYTAGWKVYTTLNSEQQTYAENVLETKSKEYAKKYNAQDMALVTVNPTTGALKAMVGGSDFQRNQINMAVRPRQPGSSMKPLVYATGIDMDKITESSVFLDEEINISGYTPKNYNKSHSGYITVRDAIKASNNIVAVKAAQLIGVKNIQNYAKQMGISTLTNQDYGLSMALGGLYKGISPYEMASAYSTFANGGLYMSPYYIEKITDRFGTTLYNSSQRSRRVLKQETADSITDMLIYNVESGTGYGTGISGFQCAGKTGTTNDNRDLWYVGFAEDAVTAIWVGNSNNKKLSGGSGSSTAGRVWHDYMAKYLKGHKASQKYKRLQYQPFNIIGEGDKVYLADSSCALSGRGKTLYMVKENAPKEKKTCSDAKLSGNDVIEKVKSGEISVKVAAETGYVQELITAGYAEELKRLGYDVSINDMESSAETITIPQTNTESNNEEDVMQKPESNTDSNQGTKPPTESTQTENTNNFQTEQVTIDVKPIAPTN